MGTGMGMGKGMGTGMDRNKKEVGGLILGGRGVSRGRGEGK